MRPSSPDTIIIRCFEHGAQRGVPFAPSFVSNRTDAVVDGWYSVLKGLVSICALAIAIQGGAA